MGTELFHAGGRTDGQTDMTKLVVAVWKFCDST
jgi:hypothetical protein